MSTPLVRSAAANAAATNTIAKGGRANLIIRFPHLVDVARP